MYSNPTHYKLMKRNRDSAEPLLNIERGHNPGAYFWTMPVRVLNLDDVIWHSDNQDCLDDVEISIAEETFEDFLYPVFLRHFQNDLPENAGRGEEYLPERYRSGIAFEWVLTDNFYTFAQIEAVIRDIQEILDCLRNDYANGKLDYMRDGLRNLPYYLPENRKIIEKFSTDEADAIAKKNIKHLTDFYENFTANLEQMINAGKEQGYKLISVCGP